MRWRLDVGRSVVALALILGASGCASVNGSAKVSANVSGLVGVEAFALAASPAAQAPMPGASPAAFARAAELSRGINFGNMLDAPNEGDWGLQVKDEFIALVGTEGFTKGVRLPVRWSNHASADASAIIDPAFLRRVDSVVAALLARGATVMLNMHHYRQLDGDPLDPGEQLVDPAVRHVRFLSMWRQIARHYANHSPKLIFELYNEPHGELESRWNELLSRALKTVRESNPERVIVLGPTTWNSATRLLRCAFGHVAHTLSRIANQVG